MENKKVFCMQCEKRLPNQDDSLMSVFDGKKEKVFEFKNGFYCEKCSEAKVKEARK